MAVLEHDPEVAVQALLTDTLLTEIGETLSYTVGVVPRSREELIGLPMTETGVIFDSAQWGPDDTPTRGRLSDLVVRKLGVATHWPEGRDNVDIEAFDEKNKAAAREASWHVVEDDGIWPGLSARPRSGPLDDWRRGDNDTMRRGTVEL